MSQPVITCLDMEGVVAPEIWLAVAEKFRVDELTLTTRDIPDYDELMQKRLGVLRTHHIRLKDIQEIVTTLHPLEGAREFVAWLRDRCQVVVLSDTFYDFVSPFFMSQLGYPTIFCHTLEADDEGYIAHYRLRQRDQKRHAVAAFKGLGFRVLAAGDSYNDLSMLKEADAGILFRPPESIQQEFPQFPVTQTYADLQRALVQCGGFPS